ncbi:type II toxin-antitoxin system RelE/ParE family toxin [Bartonella rattaustraliani]|uniref:type II toxin-antitoxin system RelE/ParE family toxin n=1 Tax=Bartonella rattaustraliani TaxID=481139 RepID=UPI0002FAC723|nr:type II toxin-antitoxin system RelE/ParE family toxin [Bartonella rattaustraliani]
MINIYKTKKFDLWFKKFKNTNVEIIILQRIARLEEGHLGDVKFFSGIGELRIHYGAGYRIYFAQKGSDIILLLCGGNKSTQQKDIEQALKLKQEYHYESDPI